MVTIGSLTWTARVENAGQAQSKANDVADSMQEADERARGLNTSLGGTGDKLKSGAKKSKRLGTRMTTLTGVIGILISTLFFLGTQASAAWASLGGLGGIVATLNSVLLTAIGLGKGFVGWMAAGSAGALAFAAALGAAVGLFSVWILHITGVMDWVGRLGAMVGQQLPGWVADGLLVVISIFAGVLAAIGGFINGFIEGTMKGDLVEGIRTGVQRAKDVLTVFAGAWERTIGRVVDLASGAGEAVADALKGVWNSVIPSTVGFPPVQLPSVTINAGPLGSATVGGMTVFEGFTFDLPQLDSGGVIEDDGFYMGHAGERVLNPAEVSKTGEAGGPAPATGGGGVTIGAVGVEIGDQTLDLSTLSTMEIEELAEVIARETGLEVESIIGGSL